MPTSVARHPGLLAARIGLGISGCLPIALGILLAVRLSQLTHLVRPPVTADGVAALICLALAVAVCCAAGVGLLVFAIRHRVLSASELESLDLTPLPALSFNSIVSRFTDFGPRVRRLVVDVDRRRLEFIGCHTPRRFLAVAQAEYACSFDDLIDVYRCAHRGDSLRIVTRAGTARIPASATNYQMLCEQLPQCLPQERAAIDSDHPLFGLLYVFAALVGLFGALALVPRATSALTTALLMAVGAGVGITLIHLSVAFFNAKTGRSIVPALVRKIWKCTLGIPR